MPIRLAENRYGKAAVRLVAVDRRSDRHELRDFEVEIRFEGDYRAAHEEGDNARVYPTDSMKNSVYALARQLGVGEPETFGRALARHYLSRSPGPERVEVRIAERLWQRIEAEGRAHPHAFAEDGAERRTARIVATAEGERIEAGIRDLLVLKTTDSGFSGFPRDAFTTLPETDDRILATIVEATWAYSPAATDLGWGSTWRAVRRALLETFATHASLSVQHTLHAMGTAALERVADVDEISLVLPNRHHLKVDLEPFGLDNPNAIFVATTEPYGRIAATLRRQS
jgi:urate oxidase